MKLSKATKLVLKSFDELYIESRKIARKWNNNKTIPIAVIEEIAGITISNAEKMDLPEMPNFTKEYIKTINNVVKICKKSAKKMDSKSIPESLLREYVDAIKKGFSESVKF
jgi:penicillin-binding protein-related factor A (putative recombinase)